MSLGYLKRPLTVAAFLSAVGGGVGFALGYLYLRPDVAVVQARLDEQRQQVTELGARVQREQARLEELLGALGVSKAEGGQIRVQLDDALGRLGTADRQTGEGQTVLGAVKETVAGLENDRLLLVELRKEQPQKREEALRFWENLKSVAVRSDPALGPKADRILVAAPSYFDWAEKTYASRDELAQAYFATGAFQFENLLQEFTRNVLLLVIERIDTVVDLTR